ncbi:MAG: hypothetical protein ACLFVJ_20510, partial [Persicimonas sp.]
GRPNRWSVDVAENGLWQAGLGFDWWPGDLEEQPPRPEGELGEIHEVETVLTIAHIDQDPRVDDPDRMRALCQRCHLTYDSQPAQRAKRQRIYAELRGQQSIFGGTL